MPLARRIHEFCILSVGSKAAQQWIGLKVGIGKESIFNTTFEDAKCTQLRGDSVEPAATLLRIPAMYE